MFFNQTIEADGSFVKVASKDALEMAKDTLQWVENERTTRKRQAIEREQKRLNNGFWHKLFRCKEVTFEEAEESIQNDPWNFDYNFGPVMFYKTESACNRIINAAKHADEIYISTEDLRRIS
jgi:hypothetical protein